MDDLIDTILLDGWPNMLYHKDNDLRKKIYLEEQIETQPTYRGHSHIGIEKENYH